MPRQSLPDRRPNVTMKVMHRFAGDREQNLLVTFGFSLVVTPMGHRQRVAEVFCADFKEGTDLHTLITDACVCLSLLLQHGYDAKALRTKFMPAPKSLLSTLIEAAIELEQERAK